MLFTISTTHRPATDLGYLLHKNPGRVHEAELAFGTAVMFYPHVAEDRATFALALDIDPVALVRGKGRGNGGRGDSGIIAQYVNDRPYVASSLLSVAMSKTLRSAMNGLSKERPELVKAELPLKACVLPLPVRGSEGLVERLFAPLGYRIEVEPIPLDEKLAWMGPDWRMSPYVKLTLSANCRLSSLLSHLYVLIPVLDRAKHYFIDRAEVDKLLAKGEGWLGAHPERTLIAHRYLDRKKGLASEALARLAALDEMPQEVEAAEGSEAAAAEAATGAVEPEPVVGESRKDAAEQALEAPIRLHDVRLDRVAAVLAEAGVRRVVDLGCGSGKLLKRLMAERQFTEIVGVDASTVALNQAKRRLRLEKLSERQRRRIRLIQGALTYRDRRIEGYDAVALVEVIEHLDPDRLSALERVLLEFARPELAVITTPNREFNARFEGLADGRLRHADHRFEWTRAEFRAWCDANAARYGYDVRYEGLGEEDAELGSPSQMAVFERREAAKRDASGTGPA